MHNIFNINKTDLLYWLIHNNTNIIYTLGKETLEQVNNVKQHFPDLGNLNQSLSECYKYFMHFSLGLFTQEVKMFKYNFMLFGTKWKVYWREIKWSKFDLKRPLAWLLIKLSFETDLNIQLH